MGTIFLSILRTLTYFDIFQYPLTKEEIRLFNDRDIDENCICEELKNLIERGLVFEDGHFYSIKNDPTLKLRRILGNSRAEGLLQRAFSISKFLFQFPFVKGIGISGSLSKNFADEKSDIDYFIITKSNRLWLARSFMHCYKQFTYLTGKWKWYCMNYFIDEEALIIAEKNIFTATEVVTLLPVCSDGIFDDFFSKNDWSFEYYPNQKKGVDSKNIKTKKLWIKSFTELLLDNQFGDFADKVLMNLTLKRAKLKEKKILAIPLKSEFRGFKTGRHFARPHPDYFQRRIITLYENEVKKIEEKLAMSFAEKKLA